MFLLCVRGGCHKAFTPVFEVELTWSREKWSTPPSLISSCEQSSTDMVENNAFVLHLFGILIKTCHRCYIKTLRNCDNRMSPLTPIEIHFLVYRKMWNWVQIKMWMLGNSSLMWLCVVTIPCDSEAPTEWHFLDFSDTKSQLLLLQSPKAFSFQAHTHTHTFFFHMFPFFQVW